MHTRTKVDDFQDDLRFTKVDWANFVVRLHVVAG